MGADRPPPRAPPAAPEPDRMRPGAYKHYVLAILTLMQVVNGVDRTALGLMLQDIKAEFHLTDTQLGFLSGLAFALFYSVMGIPIARLADRGNRVTILSWVLLLWSAALALCGAVGSFVQLLVARIGVAVGEAGCLPVSFSLIADYFTRAERPRAVAIYGGIGGTISLVVGYFGAGWLIELYGWRQTFLWMAVPCLVLAALAWLTVKEPRMHKARTPDGVGVPDAPLVAPPSLRAVVVRLWANHSFRHLLMCLSVVVFFNFGISRFA